MKKLILLILMLTVLAGCSFKVQEEDPDKEKFSIEINKDNKDEE